MTKTLDTKLAAIHADPSGAPDFILADAKDADMAFGLAATGVDPATGRPRSLAEFRDQIREVVRQGLVDVMLMSASTNDLLTGEGLFADSAVTPAVRANDSTDIHVLTGAPYPQQPSRPLRTPRIDEIMRGGTEPGALLDHAGRATPSGTAPRSRRTGTSGPRPNKPASATSSRSSRRTCRRRSRTSAVSSTTSSPGRWPACPRSGRPVFLKLPYLRAAGDA